MWSLPDVTLTLIETNASAFYLEFFICLRLDEFKENKRTSYMSLV